MAVRRWITMVGSGAMGLAAVIAAAPQPAFAALSAPTGVTAVRSATDARSVQVSWKAVAGVSSYTVGLSDGVTEQVSVADRTSTTLKLTAADTCATYLVRVGARDAAGAGGTSGYVTVRSLGPGAVLGLAAVRGATHTTVTATWRAPAWTGFQPITGYRAQLLRIADATIVSTQTVQEPTAGFTGVDRARVYKAIVVPLNVFGSCATAETFVDFDRPKEPTSLVATRSLTAPSTVMVSWIAPLGTAPVTNYMVSYTTGQTTRQVRVDAASTATTLTLDRASAWTLQVFAYNDIGASASGTNQVVVPAV